MDRRSYLLNSLHCAFYNKNYSVSITRSLAIASGHLTILQLLCRANKPRGQFHRLRFGTLKASPWRRLTLNLSL